MYVYFLFHLFTASLLAFIVIDKKKQTLSLEQGNDQSVTRAIIIACKKKWSNVRCIKSNYRSLGMMPNAIRLHSYDLADITQQLHWFLPNNITADSAALAPSQFVMKIRFYFCCFSLRMMPLKKKKERIKSKRVFNLETDIQGENKISSHLPAASSRIQWVDLAAVEKKRL